MAAAGGGTTRLLAPACTPDAVCAVFFTGGTTGSPKAVPHTHRALLWLAAALQAEHPAPVADDVRHAGTLCLAPYFHVMGFVANLVFNLHCRCRASLLAEPEARLSPRLMLHACADLTPSMLNTVPWIVEGLVALLQSNEEQESRNASERASTLSEQVDTTTVVTTPHERNTTSIRGASIRGASVTASPISARTTLGRLPPTYLTTSKCGFLVL